MIWIKRVLPFLIIIGLWYGYDHYKNIKNAEKQAEIDKYALVTAQTWIASLKYRADTDYFIHYRDSLLTANGLSPEKVRMYVQQYANKSEKLEPMGQQVEIYVDSLLKIEDSLQAIADSIALQDSLNAADSL